MAANIKISNHPNKRFTINIGGVPLDILCKFSERSVEGTTPSWHISLYNTYTNELVKGGIKLIPNQNLTGRYDLPELSGGDIFCLRVKDTKDKINYNNVGIGKDYAVMYLTPEEKFAIYGV